MPGESQAGLAGLLIVEDTNDAHSAVASRCTGTRGFLTRYLGTVEGLWGVDAGRDDHHIVPELPESLDQVGEPDLHACSVCSKTSYVITDAIPGKFLRKGSQVVENP